MTSTEIIFYAELHINSHSTSESFSLGPGAAFSGLILLRLSELVSRGVLELTSELLEGIFCNPCLPMLGPNDVLRMPPRPSTNIPEVVR